MPKVSDPLGKFNEIRAALKEKTPNLDYGKLESMLLADVIVAMAGQQEFFYLESP